MAKTNKQWIRDHLADPYVKKAFQQGYPSRAAYKLLEIQERERIILPGMTIVDLGAAPGGWSMVARDLVGENGKVIALDRLDMAPLKGVTFIKGDFTEDVVLKNLLQSIDSKPVDVIICDMAPNISGHKAIDQPRSVYLVELALECAGRILKPGGSFLVKIFQGEGTEALVAEIKTKFSSMKYRKPKASRSCSREIYVLARDFIGYNSSFLS